MNKSRQLEALKAKSISHYAGYNVVRVGFADRCDAERYLRLLRELGRAYSYRFYGIECPASVQNNGNGWEVYHG